MFVNKIIKTTKRKSLGITGATLLPVEEAKKLDSDYLKDDDTWWLRSPGIFVFDAACVDGEDGTVDVCGYNVVKVFGVRPALIISNLGDFEVGDKFEVGNKFENSKYTFTVITDNYALCDNIIGSSPFREDHKADDANDYEKSDIKKYVDEWFLNYIY